MLDGKRITRAERIQLVKRQILMTGKQVIVIVSCQDPASFLLIVVPDKFPDTFPDLFRILYPVQRSLEQAACNLGIMAVRINKTRRFVVK